MRLCCRCLLQYAEETQYGQFMGQFMVPADGGWRKLLGALCYGYLVS